MLGRRGGGVSNDDWSPGHRGIWWRFRVPDDDCARNNRGTADRYTNAAIDEVAFYDYRLPEHRIRAHYEAYAGSSVRWALDSAITSSSNTKNIRPRGPRDPGVLTVAAPGVVWLSGTYLSYVDYSMAVKMLGTAGSSVLLREDGSFAGRPRLVKQGGRFTNRATTG